MKLTYFKSDSDAKHWTITFSKFLVVSIFGCSLFLSYRNETKADEKKSVKKSVSTSQKSRTPPSSIDSDAKRFDTLKLNEPNIWRCENNVIVKTANSSEGYLMFWNNKLYIMNKIDALKGVQRYTNDTNHLNWIEIPDKAMLFDFKLGQRLLDYCKTPELASITSSPEQDDLLK